MKSLHTKITLILLALALSSLEMVLPRIPLFPWLKPGLANSVLMVWILWFGRREALLFLFSRIFITSLYFGFSFFTITTSLGGALPALFVMSFLKKNVLDNKMGLYSMALVGAIFHNLGQLGMISLLLKGNSFYLFHIPAMGFASLFFGLLTAILAKLVIEQRPTEDSRLDFVNIYAHLEKPILSPTKIQIFLSTFLLIVAISVAFVSNLIFLIVLIALIFFEIIFTHRSHPTQVLKNIFNPFLKYYPLFIFILIFQLLPRYGLRSSVLSFLTIEGINNSIVYSAKLYIWLSLTSYFKRTNFYAILMELLKKKFPNNRETLLSTLIATEIFPILLNHVKHVIKSFSFKTTPLFPLLTLPARLIASLFLSINKSIQSL